MNHWQNFCLFIARDYRDIHSLEKVWDLSDRIIPKIQTTKSEFFFLHYCDPTHYPEGPHLEIHIKNPSKEFIDLIEQLKQEYSITESQIEEETPDKEEGLIAKQIFNKVYKIGKHRPQELANELKNIEEYGRITLHTGKHYLHNMLKMTCGSIDCEEEQFLMNYF